MVGCRILWSSFPSLLAFVTGQSLCWSSNRFRFIISCRKLWTSIWVETVNEFHTQTNLKAKRFNFRVDLLCMELQELNNSEESNSFHNKNKMELTCNLLFSSWILNFSDCRLLIHCFLFSRHLWAAALFLSKNFLLFSSIWPLNSLGYRFLELDEDRPSIPSWSERPEVISTLFLILSANTARLLDSVGEVAERD